MNLKSSPCVTNTASMIKSTRQARHAGMEIQHIGSSKLCSQTSTLHLNNIRQTSTVHLNNILHIPRASKSLVSVNRLTRDNDVLIEFHPDHFSVKELGTRRTLLKGRCEGCLYPLKPASNKKAFVVVKLFSSLWHSRLGHVAAPSCRKSYATTSFLLF